jgi:predicted DNA-binding protein (UPF0251 family)
MPRPRCPRCISFSPTATYFKPAGIPLRELAEVGLGADELEALRLADVEDLYHAEGARRLGVSRQTFDRIVRAARRKVAKALVEGLALRLGTDTAGAKRARRGEGGGTTGDESSGSTGRRRSARLGP